MSDSIWRVSNKWFIAQVVVSRDGHLIDTDPVLRGWKGKLWDKLFRHCRNVGWDFRFVGYAPVSSPTAGDLWVIPHPPSPN